jgi:cytochrome c biogenesis protein CcmG/thiol:disulfide interchange protein DsbE
LTFYFPHFTIRAGSSLQLATRDGTLRTQRAWILSKASLLRAGLAAASAALLITIAACVSAKAGQAPSGQDSGSLEVSQALAQGDQFLSVKEYEKALAAYQHADKLSHHTCAVCYLRIVSILRKAGDFDDALDMAKKAVAAAGDNKVVAAQAHLVRGSLFVSMANKPNDKKLREAEDEFRQALALQPTLSLAHRNLGIALIKQNRDTDGIAELNLFVAAPGNSEKNIAEARGFIANPERAREPFAPPFAFTSLEGGNVSSEALRGKVLLIDFWATWCPPCRESVPVIRDLHKKYADKAFELVGVSADGDEQTLKSFVTSNRMNWTEYLDLSGSIGESFEIDGYPTYVVVDKQGVIRYKQSGFGPSVAAELDDAINKALKKPYVAAAGTVSAAPVPASAAPSSATSSSAVPATQGNAGSASPSPAPQAIASPTSAPARDFSATSGDTYHNGSLGFSYPYPRGWTVATPDMIRSANASMQQMNAASQQSKQTPGHASAGISELIFYAYGAAKNDNSFRAVPSVRITSLESFGAMLTPEVMKREGGSRENLGMKSIRGPEKFSVGDQDLYRMDFEDPREGQTWVSLIETVVYDHVLTIEILAGTPVQLELLVSTVKYSVFADADKK